jgi:transposase
MQTVTTVVSTSPSQSSRCTELMPPARCWSDRQLKRRLVLAFFQKLPPYPVGIEACASCH